uniref:Uncharacterized protein n=1 Tax=Podoviridae sp. ctxqo3 TaxID=2827755 RepID=A0A8S5SZ25_9CAUD|nr:MAG TPA: hypothetical protein [Podoviridae sp. ctxqo3]
MIELSYYLINLDFPNYHNITIFVIANKSCFIL